MTSTSHTQTESAESREIVPNSEVYRKKIKRTVEAVKRLRSMDRIPKGTTRGKFDPRFTPTIKTLHYLSKVMPFAPTNRQEASSSTES